MPRVALLAVVASLFLGSAHAQTPRAVVESIDLAGVTVYDREHVLRIIRAEPGSPLRRPAAAVAQTLETRYHDDGFLAARVTGAFDAPSATLRLDVVEGRLQDVAFPDLSPAAAERARRAAALESGEILRRSNVLDAFDRLEEASEGALRPGDAEVEAEGEGARLLLRPRISRARLSPRVGASGLATEQLHSRVDGVAFTIGGDLALFDLGAYNHARAYAVASYGFASGTVRYALGALRPLGGGGRTTVGYEFHDLTATDDLHRAQGLDEAPGSVIAFERSADYFRRLGHEAYLFVRLADRLQVGLAWRSDRYGSLAVETGSSDPNPPVAEGLMRSAIASARFSTGRVFPDREDERRSFLQRDLFNAFREPPPGLRGEATFEWASPGTLGGDFAFRRLLVSLRGRAGGSRLSVDARGILGFTWGDPPEQKRLSLGGFGRLRGYPFAALPGADVALGTVECRLDAARALPRLIAFYDGGIAWGTGATDGAFKHSLGVGLKWPAEAPFFVRVDFARALGDPSVRGARTLARLQLPF